MKLPPKKVHPEGEKSQQLIAQGSNKIPGPEGMDWLTTELKNCYSEILNIPWILNLNGGVSCNCRF